MLTTHYMDEAEKLCDRLVVMDAGKIAAEGSPRELIDRYSTPEVLELRFDPSLHESAAEKLAAVPAQRREVGRPGCSMSKTGAPRWPRSAGSAWTRSPRSSGAARWRTCSCG